MFNNCSLNKESKYWTNDTYKKKSNEMKNIQMISKKLDDITKMTQNEYKIYIENHTNKSKYPDLSQWMM